MYGGSSSKLNRPAAASSRLSLGGGGGGNPKRFVGGPPQPSRTSAPGGLRDRNSGGRVSGSGGGLGGGAGGGGVEESFNLVSGNDAVAFAAIIRLVPDLVEEIRRLEGQGGKARIKFDATESNPSGNVIEVGGKEYRFTWSREFGDLCDIYEERQSGVDGNGLLVESGSAWRKLNVQRVLDESTKKHVKMRTEEAEKKLKSRKAIVLEPGNPSMKSQIKQIAAAEVNPRRMHFLQKREPPFKKQKVGPSSVSVSGPPKPTFKSGSSVPAKPIAKGSSRLSASPLPSPSHQSVALTSPYRLENMSNRNVVAEDMAHSYPTSKDSAATFHRDSSKDISAAQERPGNIVKYGERPMDLQNILIKLLKENPKGMSLKALEKVIGDTVPNCGKKIEPILKKIATYQAPGRYLLKAGMELDSFQRPSPGSGSSPEENQNLVSASELNLAKSPATLAEKVEVHDMLGSNLSSGADLNASENIDIERNSPDIFGDKKDSENSEGQVGSSSDSGSDSDSESHSSDSRSDSGSPSGSRSRSRSQAGSGSGSSSDSESDASSNSKEASDEDVDIMTSDDEKVPKPKLHSSGPGFALPAIGRSVQDGINDNQDEHTSDAVDIEKDMVDIGPNVDENASEKQGPNKVSEEHHGFAPDQKELLKRQNFIGSLFDEREESSKRDRSSSSVKNLSKSGRGSGLEHTDLKHEKAKKLKVESMVQTSTQPGSSMEHHFSPHKPSPDKFLGNSYDSPVCPTFNNSERDNFTDFGFQKSHNQTASGKSSSYSQQTGRKSSDKSLRGSTHDLGGKINRHAEGMSYGTKFTEKSSNLHEGIPTQKEKYGRDDLSDGLGAEKVSKGMREGGDGDKDLMPIVADAMQPRRVELLEKSKESGHNGSSLIGSSQKGRDKSAVDKGTSISGRVGMLQRELSDLEMGELREPFPEVTAPKKQFERKPDSWKLDSGRGKPPGKASLDSVKMSPSNLSARVQSESSSRKRPLEHRDDSRATLNQLGSHFESQRPSKADYSEANLPLKKDLNKLRKSEPEASPGPVSDEIERNLKAPTVNGLHHSDLKGGSSSQFMKENRRQSCSTAATSVNGQKDLNLDAVEKVRECSDDDSSCSYWKYEKDEPELKGQIKDISQYKEYVQEYQDKYESYLSVYKILENYRIEFEKIGDDLELTKGRDIERYNKLVAHLRESYRQCAERHRRLKKIFVVLHEELKHLKQMIKDFAAAHS